MIISLSHEEVGQLCLLFGKVKLLLSRQTQRIVGQMQVIYCMKEAHLSVTTVADENIQKLKEILIKIENELRDISQNWSREAGRLLGVMEKKLSVSSRQ